MERDTPAMSSGFMWIGRTYVFILSFTFSKPSDVFRRSIFHSERAVDKSRIVNFVQQPGKRG